MTTKIKKIAVSLLAFVVAVSAFTFGAFSVAKATVPTGSYQAYDNGKVYFEDRLWETPNAIEITASSEFAAKVQEAANGGAKNSKGTALTVNDYQNYSVNNGSVIKGYFIDGATYKGQVTKVFCYVGFPEWATATNKAPAMVLVHGGGGTAYAQWVKHWADRGYAAIAMDTEGCVPYEKADGSHVLGAVDGDGLASRHPYHHGPENPGFQDVKRSNDIEDQWFYQAVASVIASNSFLRSFDCVDTSKVGITGVSYGSYLTCMAVSYDSRYLFAAPVYGSLDQQNTETYFGNNIRNFPWTAELWDDSKSLANTQTSFMFVMGNQDAHFSVEATTSTDKVLKDSRMLIRNALPHSHYHGATNGKTGGETANYINEVFWFADSFCRGYAQMADVLVQPTKTNFTVQYSVPAGISLTSATLYYTTDAKLINNSLGYINKEIYLDYQTQSATTWHAVNLTLNGNTVDVPKSTLDSAGATFYYVNVTDNNGNEISTHVVEYKSNADYFLKPIRSSNGEGLGTYFDFSQQDANGWSTYNQSFYYYHVAPVYENGTATGGYTPVIAQDAGGVYISTYGVGENTATYANGVSSFALVNSGFTVNYKEFNVYEDIEFYFNASPSAVWGANAYYTFSIFDDLGTAFKASNETRETSFGQKLSFMGANYDFTHLNENVNGKLLVYGAGSQQKLSGNIFSSNYNKDTWNTEYCHVKVSIGEENTEVYINGVKLGTFAPKRADFKWGTAYLHLCSNANVGFNIKHKESNAGYYQGSIYGDEYRFNSDENGWSVHKIGGANYVDANGNQAFGAQYGSSSLETVDDITKIKFYQTSNLINYKPFDVTEEIVIRFNVSAAVDGSTEFKKSFYVLSLFDNIDTAFKAGTEDHDSTKGGKVILFGCNATTGAWNEDRSAVYGKFQATVGGVAKTNANSVYPSTFDSTTCFDQFYTIKISIGTSSTTVNIEGEVLTFNSLTRNNFEDGVAYLKVMTQDSMQINFKHSDAEYKYHYGNSAGAELVTTSDANGWHNTTISQGGYVDWKGDSAVAPLLGRQSVGTVDANGYSDIKLYYGSYVVNYNALDLTKPIRLSYTLASQVANDTSTKCFVNIALFDELSEAFNAGNNCWNTAYGTKLLIQQSNTDAIEGFDGSFADMNAKPKFSGGNVQKTYDTAIDGEVIIDLLIGETKTVYIVNGEVCATITGLNRASFADGDAYLMMSNTNYSDVKIKVQQIDETVYTSNAILNERISVSANVILGGNYYNPKVEITYLGQTTTISESTFKNGSYKFRFNGVLPQNMGDTMTIKFSATDASSGTSKTIHTKENYSVQSYLEGLLADGSASNKLKTLCVDLLNYGAAAQQYAGKTSGLVNANIGAYQQYATSYTAPTSDYSSSVADGVEGVVLHGASLRLVSNVDVRIRMTLGDYKTGVKVKFTINGITTTINENQLIANEDGTYTAELDGVSVNSFGKVITISVLNASSEQIANATYSVNSYVSAMADDAEVGALVKALYCYGVSAANY